MLIVFGENRMSTQAQLEALIPIAVAAFLAGVIGLEREWRHSPAGLRTHMLISMGAALVMVMASGLYAPDAEARLAANVITGVGFLGAGVIIHRKTEVRELTTAASLWLVAMIGMTVGARLYVLAGGTTFLGWFVLWVLRRLTKRSKFTGRSKSAGADKYEVDT
jgi:putative Mg2+ transporter-C (MgtC) family protein